MIYLQLLQPGDGDKLYIFERNNRNYFEKFVPSRGDEFYQKDYFRERLRELLKEQADGKSYFYLIKDADGEILGRINLTDVETSQKVGSLGYRIGESHIGRGIAGKAVELLKREAGTLKLARIEAKTTSDNIASQKVLKKQGFEEKNERILFMKESLLLLFTIN